MIIKADAKLATAPPLPLLFAENIAEFPERVELVTVRLDDPELTVAFKIPPPLPEAVFSEVVLTNKVELETVRFELVLTIPPPPLVALLFEMVELEMEMVFV